MILAVSSVQVQVFSVFCISGHTDTKHVTKKKKLINIQPFILYICADLCMAIFRLSRNNFLYIHYIHSWESQMEFSAYVRVKNILNEENYYASLIFLNIS